MYDATIMKVVCFMLLVLLSLDIHCLCVLGYGIVTSTDGANHDELSWIVKITSVLDRTGETAEALRSGDVFDAEFIHCGKQYKKLGRYVANQLEKSVAEDAGTQNNVEIRTYTKMESKAIELGIQYAQGS